jgi:hypothetical protein
MSQAANAAQDSSDLLLTIKPLECVVDEIYSGPLPITIITPEECEEITPEIPPKIPTTPPGNIPIQPQSLDRQQTYYGEERNPSPQAIREESSPTNIQKQWVRFTVVAHSTVQPWVFILTLFGVVSWGLWGPVLMLRILRRR